MAYAMDRKPAPNRDSVEVLGATYEPGMPDCNALGNWRQKLETRDDKLRYLQTALRYWYAKEGFGSEKRKTPA